MLRDLKDTGSRPMLNYESSLEDTLVSSGEIQYSFTTDLPSNNINCFVNNGAELKIENDFAGKIIYL